MTLPEPLFRSASEFLREKRLQPKLSTGYHQLDELIGGVEKGSAYLFYGDEELVGLLVHRLMVNSTLSHFDGDTIPSCIYFNNTDYYSGKTIIDQNLIASLCKKRGADPSWVTQNIHAATAYNEVRQMILAKELAELVATDDNIQLIIAHNLTRFLQYSKRPDQAAEALDYAIKEIWSAASAHEIPMMVTGGELPNEASTLPKPIGTPYLTHTAGVMVHFERRRMRSTAYTKATLVKHPWMSTPTSAYITEAE